MSKLKYTTSFIIPSPEYETILEFVNEGNYKSILQPEEWLKIQNEMLLQCKIDTDLNLNILSQSKLPDYIVKKICNILNVNVLRMNIYL